MSNRNQEPYQHHTKWFVRVIALICAVLIFGSVFFAAFF
jgi:YbbR domain-containing protein